LGFPLVLVLAWFYEWTSEGIKPASELEVGQAVKFTGRKLDFAIIGLLVLAVGFLVVDDLVVPEREKSIAVLPFTNLSAVAEDAELFSTGMHAVLLTQLSRLSDIKVISRISVLDYADSTKSPRQIADELGVATILGGTISRAGDALQINVDLVDAGTNESLWGGSYVRELTAENVFGIQRDMAVSIVGALQATLSPEEIEQLNVVPTQSTAAYNYYLSGQAYEGQGARSARQRVQLYGLAVEEDADFALAWAALTDANADLARMTEDPVEAADLTSEALIAAVTALGLAPRLAEAHIARGIVYANEGNYDAALLEYAIAEETMPGNAWVFKQRALTLENMGRFEAAVAEFDRAVELDPRDTQTFATQGENLVVLREYERAERAFDRVLEISPDHRLAATWKVDIQRFRGDVAGMKAAIEDASFLEHPQDERWWVAFYERDYEAALRFLEDWNVPEAEKAWRYAMTYQFLSDMPERAGPHFQVLRTAYEQTLEESPDDWDVASLAEVLGYLGERETALAHARRAMELLPDATDLIGATALHLDIIWALVAAGDYRSTIEELDAHLTVPGIYSIEGLLRDPRLEPILDDSRLLELVAQYRR